MHIQFDTLLIYWLLDKDDNPVTSTAAPPPIDENKINELLPNNSLLDLENILIRQVKILILLLE